MRTTIGLVLALIVGSTGALAQGPPGDKGHGPGTHEHGSNAHRGGPGPSVQQRAALSIDRGPSIEHRSAQRSVERSQPSFRRGNDNDGNKHARQAREEGAHKARPDKADQTSMSARANKDGGKQKFGQAEGQARRAKDTQKSSSSQGAASGESGRSTEKLESNRGHEKDEAAFADRKAPATRVEDAKRVELSADKRNRVVAALRDKSDFNHRTNVRFDLRVGGRLPRDWVFLPVPIAVVEIVPEYRDYLFAYVDDDYVICDPDTYEIVAIIPASGGPEYAIGDSHDCTDRIYLDEDDRDLILRSIRRDDRVDVRDLTVGWSVPRDIELLRFPDRVLARIGELGSCRYFVAEDQIAIVSPDQEKVVLLIDRG
jgi:hypothetical protein